MRIGGFGWLLLGLALLVGSCNRRVNLLYLRDAEHAAGALASSPPVYKLRPGDLLHVQLITSNPQVSAAFNNPTGITIATHQRDDQSLYLQGHSLNDSGYVSLPFLGDVHVAGLSMEGARGAIAQRARAMYHDATVVVKLANFRVTVVGEVQRPGLYRNFNDHLNIFEALAMAGDATENALRTDVLVVRNTPAGRVTHRLDLTDPAVLASEGFYILPNDVIVVEPRGNRAFMMNLPYINMFLSTITTALLLLRYIRN